MNASKIELYRLNHSLCGKFNDSCRLMECQHHPGQRCEANYLQCNEPICFKCYISGPYQEHKVEELPKTHENLKKKIEKDNQEIKDYIIVKYQREK